MAKLITLDSPTSTGGKVITASSKMIICGRKVVLIGDIATCNCGKNYCNGQGKIVKGFPRDFKIDGVEPALKGDVVLTTCGTCVLLDDLHNVDLGGVTGQAIQIGRNGAGVEIGEGVQVSINTLPVASNTLAQASNQAVTQSALTSFAGQQAYAFTEKEWNQNLQDDLKAYLENRHTQVCIFSVNDAAKCALNIWHQKNEEGETIGKEVLDLLESIHSKIDMGIGIISAAKVSKALGGLGVTVKQYIDLKGVERVIISSLWNDPKIHYAVVNGLNVKKNHPYPITNFTIKQLGVLAEDTLNGFKKGAVLSLIISAAINTNELVFNDDYHLVDWCGSMGSDLFKLLAVGAVIRGGIYLIVALEVTVPILVGGLVWVGVDVVISDVWDEYNIEDYIVNSLKEVVDAR
ncbi:PAAR domain-containing protein [Vibrio parahaemolyticus]|nr:PAAR domain-containing protein [Vibrio parahaemolyticus]